MKIEGLMRNCFEERPLLPGEHYTFTIHSDNNIGSITGVSEVVIVGVGVSNGLLKNVRIFNHCDDQP